jgi:hypothetical protein
MIGELWPDSGMMGGLALVASSMPAFLGSDRGKREK